MANRRMISKSISVSDETNSISDFAALLFTWLIPHADDYGIIPGSPGRIKALVVPRRSQCAAQVSEALEEMREAGLIYRYSNKGQEYIQLVRFDSHQEGLHKRTAPRSPVHDTPDSVVMSGNFPEVPGISCPTEPNPTEINPTEGKGTTTTAGGDPVSDGNCGDVVEMLSRNICKISSPIEMELIREWTRTLPGEWIPEAIRQAALNKAGSIKYVDTILRSWNVRYRPGDKPWVKDRRSRQRSSPAKESFAMEKLEAMAQEAMEHDKNGDHFTGNLGDGGLPNGPGQGP